MSVLKRKNNTLKYLKLKAQWFELRFSRYDKLGGFGDKSKQVGLPSNAFVRIFNFS